MCRSLAIQLRLCERRILSRGRDYAETRIEKVKKKQNLAPVMGGPPPEKLAMNELDDDDLNEDEDLKNINENKEKLDVVDVINDKGATGEDEVTKQVETKENATTETKNTECYDEACDVCDDLANIEVAAETPIDYNAVD